MSEDTQPKETDRKKERMSYIYTYIHNIRDSLNLPDSSEQKTHVLLSMDQSVHEVAKFLSPLLHKTMSDLFAEAFLKELETLADKLPENIVFNIVHQLPLPKQENTIDEMLDLEVDILTEKLSSLSSQIQALDKTQRTDNQERKKFLVEQLDKQLSKGIKVARRSKSLEFQKLVIDVREVLRSHQNWKNKVKILYASADGTLRDEKGNFVRKDPNLGNDDKPWKKSEAHLDKLMEECDRKNRENQR